MKIYKVVSSSNGFKELEKTVSMMLNAGWECTGGIAFNHGYCYQAMVIDKPDTSNLPQKQHAEGNQKKPSSYIQASRMLDDLI